jgi:Pyocin activator protein PrtN
VSLHTAFLLMAQYNARAIIPLEEVCRDYFSHLTPEKLLRKISTGEIEIPIVKIESSQKSAKGIHLNDLAEYLDKRRAEAMKELHKVNKEPNS